MMNSGRRFLVGVSAAALSSFGTFSALPALAQDNPTAAPSAARGEGQDSNVIMVTAERRSEDVQDVAVSIVALTGDTLRERGVDNIDDLQSQVPSLSYVDQGAVKFVNIRGVGLSQPAPQQTIGVAIHQDGGYLAREFSFGDAFFDVASVEVLRGPQGTYQGQNASGGAIYINSVAPSVDGVSGFAEGVLGSYDRAEASAGLNLPLADTLAVRVSGLYANRDSFNVNRNSAGAETANQPGDFEQVLTRAQVLFQPADAFSLRLIYQYSKQDTGGPVYKSLLLRATEGLRETSFDTQGALNTEYNRVTGIIDWDFSSAARLHAVIAYQNTDQFTQREEDFGNSATVFFGPQVASQIEVADHYWTGEVDLISTGSGPFSWTVGAAFLDYQNESETRIAIYAAPPMAPAPTADFNTATTINVVGIRRNQAVFGEVGYAVTEELEVKLGGRYNHDESRFTSGFFAPVGNAGPRLLDLTSPMVEGDAFTGRALINWTPSDDILVYGSVSRGYKPGGFSAVFFGFGGPYEAEYVTNYEVGSKGSLAGDALNYSLSAFYMDYMGFQASLQIDPVNPLSTVVVNVDGSTSKGVEAQLFGQIGGFRWDTSLSVLDTSFGSQVVNIPPNATGFGSPPGTTNLAGRDLNYAPRFSANAGVAYEVMIGNHTLTPSLRVSHQSGQWANFLQLPYNRIPERTLVDARLAFVAEAGWQVEGYVTNLLEEEYYSAVGINPDGIGSFMAGAPREFGVRARFAF